MGDEELLSMLAAEAERRTPTIITGVEALAASGEKDSARIEELRVEQFLAGCVESGRIKPGPAATVVAAASAFNEGAQAAAEGVAEPSSVGESLDVLPG